MSERLTRVVKRTGAVVPFNRERITNAIYRAAVAVGGRDQSTAEIQWKKSLPLTPIESEQGIRNPFFLK